MLITYYISCAIVAALIHLFILKNGGIKNAIDVVNTFKQDAKDVDVSVSDFYVLSVVGILLAPLVIGIVMIGVIRSKMR
ncbi:hypothetical protein D3C78_1443330 [compost metagenome]